MLQTIRDRIQGPIIIGILVFLGLVFVVWGIGTRAFMGEGSDPTVAEVGGTKITQAQFRREYDTQYQNLVQGLGEDFRPDSIDNAALRKQVLDGLVRREVMQQYAKKMGYRVTDANVFDVISELPGTQKDGHFSVEAYRAALQRVGRTPEAFENQVREGLSAEQLHQAVETTAFVTPRELQAEWQVNHQARAFRSVHIDPASESVAEASAGDVQKYYDAHKDDFKIPQKIRVAYVELAQDKLAPAAEPAAAALQDLYTKQLKGGAFTSPEERHAAHILVKFGADKAASKKTAEAIVEQLKGGADFATLARQDSADPSSKDKGGDLGWNARGAFNPQMEQALFSMKPGEVSPPVDTMAGWDIVKALEIRPEKVKPFTDPEVQKALLDTYRQMDAAKRFQDGRERISELAFENPASLDPVAKALGLTVQSSDWFSVQGGSGIAANAEVVKAAFAPDVVQDGDNSKPVSLGPKDLVVIRKQELAPARVPALAEVTDAIRAKLKADRARDAALAQAKQVADAVRAGRSLDEAASAQHLSAGPLRSVQRSELGDDAKLAEALFALAPPSKQAPSLGQSVGKDGAVDVIQLLSVSDGQAPAADSQEGQAAVKALRDRISSDAFDSYRVMMQNKVGVKVLAPPAGSDSNPLE